MGWREARRLADVAFTELALQAIYAFRQGNPVPPSEGSDLVPKARRRVAQSKLLIAGLVGLLTLGGGALLGLDPAQRAHYIGYPLPPGLYEAAVLSGLLSLDVALLWWTGLQALPTLLTSGVLEVLEPLPIDLRTMRRTAGIVYLRLFDAPVLVIVVGTPLVVGWAEGPWAGLFALPGALSAVLLALALSLLTGRFFVRRVHGSGGGGGRTLVRWAYLLLWIVPPFGVLGFVTLAPLYFRALSALAYGGAGFPAPLVLLVYPFPLGIVPEVVSQGFGSLGVGVEVERASLLAAIAYAALAVAAVVWLYGAIGSVVHLPQEASRPSEGYPRPIVPRRPALAVLTKDLRIASRTPGFAFLILLPLLDAVALGLVSVLGPTGSTAAQGLAFGAVSSAALLATFFGPAFFALEVLAHSYARTLPLAPRSVVVGKASLVAAIYLAASSLVLGITASRVPSVPLFATFVAAELPAVLAAAFLELGVLYRWARRRGQPVTNLYAGAFNILAVSLPGLLLATAPLVLYETGGLGVMAVLSALELLAVAPLALGGGRS